MDQFCIGKELGGGLDFIQQVFASFTGKMPKVQFRIILTSDKRQPHRVISVEEAAPFVAVLRFSAEQFGTGP